MFIMVSQDFKKASKILDEITPYKIRERGFVYHTLFTKWSEIIGDDMSEYVTPASMRFYSGKDDAVLTLKINAALGPQIQLMSENILQRINNFYGFSVIRKLKFKKCFDLNLLGKNLEILVMH